MKKTKEFICTACPNGCGLSVNVENGKVISVVGNKCPRGIVYGKSEIENPVRPLTGTIKVKGSTKVAVVPVKSAKPIPKEKLLECAKELKYAVVEGGAKIGDVVLKNIFGTGIDIIATENC
jgi:CxxC motif-containing protein